MCVEENYLKDIWGSLFKIDVFSELKNVDDKILGPFMLIERTVFAFKELGLNYVRSLEDLKNVKAELDVSSRELLVVKEKLNETQKLCENCVTLSKDLELARKRANDAEFRVTQIAQILVVRSSDEPEKQPEMAVRSPSVSPKRKKSCVRVKDDCQLYSSQTVETGCDGETQVSPLSSNKYNSLSSPSKKISKCKLKPVVGSAKRLSKSIEIDSETVRRVSPRKNLSADFACENDRLSPGKSKKSPSGSKKSPSKVLQYNRCFEDWLTEYTKNCGSELDRIWFDSSKRVVTTNRNNEAAPSNRALEQPLSELKNRNKGPAEEKSKKTNKISILENPTKKLDNYFDIVFEKKVAKKKFKQLTLQMNSNKGAKQTEEKDENNCSDLSDSELILPSPDKCLIDGIESQDFVQMSQHFIKDLIGSGNTSTQIPVENSPNKVLDKRKVSTPTKKKAVATTSNKGLDNSYDVILDRSQKSESPKYKYKGKTVRGKARAKLEGWDCEDCKRYYELACKNQSPSKVKATMNLCSRHRSKHKQTRPPTPPGFWDIDIPDTPE